MNNNSFQFGMGNAECGRSAGRALHAAPSAFRLPNSAYRSAVTLLEVLISMGVLTVGILGVAALFPVGSHYALRGEIYDRADAAAAQAFNDAVTRGLLDSEQWVSGGIGPQNFTRDYATDFRARYAAATTATTPQAKADLLRGMIGNCGSVVFIDPMGVATGLATNASYPTPLRSAPASLVNGVTTSATNFNVDKWYPWNERAAILRLSVRGQQFLPTGPAPASLARSELLTTLQDDLAVDNETPADEPAQQLALSYNSTRLLRQSSGNFSYLISVAPRTFEAWAALPFGGRGQAYDVSAVVFHRRPRNRLASGATLSDVFDAIPTTVAAERICGAAVTVQGTSGGEVRLYANTGEMPDAYSAAGTLASNLPWKDLKTGQYVMLFGPSPASHATRPLLFAQWYRVVAVDDADAGVSSGTHVGPSVALRGPDWPWLPSGDTDPTQTIDASELSEDLRVLILDGAVAVHTRTMRLDAGTAWRK